MAWQRRSGGRVRSTWPMMTLFLGRRKASISAELVEGSSWSPSAPVLVSVQALLSCICATMSGIFVLFLNVTYSAEGSFTFDKQNKCSICNEMATCLKGF